ncbi:putative cyclin B [Rosellinia necatrix]|uniref:Putative cyclin B n=1 Tax=Rosellinia necatrix TaxID=77044 RepID=A0A1W2TUU7_ROSNE|nr:putative cyclin B [Rosellinia necatrix]
MPPAGRTARSRIASNENDENTNSTRLTRAKAAALDVDVAQPTKQPLQTKRSAINANPPAGRRRAALGDVSNVGKADAVEGKKPAASRAGLVSKAAQPTGIQKSTTRSTTTRTVLGAKETKKTEIKRTGSGSGAIGTASQKRKIASATSTVKTDVLAETNEPVRKRAHTTENEQKKPVRSESKAAKPVPAEKQSVEKQSVEPEAPIVEPELPDGVKDLDHEDLDDPNMAAEYAVEIFEYLRQLETKSIPNPKYMDHQDDIGWRTRGILIDWLIEVHTRFHLLPETLFLTINIIDRFLSKKVVQLDRLQLVGITAMFIASKYEEVLSPHVANFKHVADDGFTEEEILSAERFILGTLNYDLSYPNPMNFLRRISKADNYDIQTRTIAKYLMEISLLDHRFMECSPSQVAAGAMYLARLIFDRGEWDDTIAHYAGYTEKEIEPVVELMVDYLARPVIHEAFYKKYASKKFLKASLVTREWAKRHAHHFGIEDIHLTLDEVPS